MADFSRESMQELFTFEMNQLVEQLEQIIIEEEESEQFSEGAVNEIFRIMHTIKGSSAMMLYDNMASVSHKIEDMFYFIRENNPENIDYSSLTDLVLAGLDFIKEELAKVEAGVPVDGNGEVLINRVQLYLDNLKKDEGAAQEQSSGSPDAPDGMDEAALEAALQEEIENEAHQAQDSPRYKVTLWFEEDCGMENARAFNAFKRFEGFVSKLSSIPEDLTGDANAESYIRENGVTFEFTTEAPEVIIREVIDGTIFLKDYLFEPYVNEALPHADEILSISGGHKYDIRIHFTDGCEMENVRAYTVTRNLENIAKTMSFEPEDILENDETIKTIRKEGFKIVLITDAEYDEVKRILSDTIFLETLVLEEVTEGLAKVEAPGVYDAVELKAEKTVLEPEDTAVPQPIVEPPVIKPPEPAVEMLPAVVGENEDQHNQPSEQKAVKADLSKKTGNAMISINVNKLDTLMNLTGELVTTEAMVTQNPDLDGLELENFQKAARQLRKIINDIQDTVMGMRMVPLAPTFMKMHRVVRDMSKNLNKEIHLELLGEDTEVDKNIIEHISDPLMHIIRNSIDHGIESTKERLEKNKPEKGLVVLEAKNAGGEVLISVKDDGSGIDPSKILAKAKASGILKKPESEYTKREIVNFIFLPGFSTNEDVTSYSGRGVGMDVVTTNIEKVGGSVVVDSELGEGTVTTLRIPLTLAIINGMIVKLGENKYTIPINAIKESFKVKDGDIFRDPDGNEMIMIRGECYNVMRLHDFFELSDEHTSLEDGIMIMMENDEKTICVLADELIGEQQVVVKAMPKYIKKIPGISGCTLLGNGDISLIIDVQGFFKS